MVILRPSFLKPGVSSIGFPKPFGLTGFVCHPSTSELAEQLMVDPESLSNENYSGMYDENGDYIPQYCDNPDDIPRSMLQANSDSPASPPGTPEAEKTNTAPTNSSIDSENNS